MDEDSPKAETPLRVDVMHKAAELTCGDRNKDYGTPYDNHAAIAECFNAMTGHNLTAADVAKVHIATKLCRLKTSPMKEDHYVDMIAYAGIVWECEQHND